MKNFSVKVHDAEAGAFATRDRIKTKEAYLPIKRNRKDALLAPDPILLEDDDEMEEEKKEDEEQVMHSNMLAMEAGNEV